MGLQLVRWLISVSVPFLLLRTVDANVCQQSNYINYPQDVYGIEGQQLCITCRHSSISNNPTFEKNGIMLDCGGAGNPDCTVNSAQGTLCFNPINANNLGIMYECVHQIDFITFCRVGFNISRGVIPTISDSSLSRQLDYDSGSLTLQPTIEHGLPAAIVNWYHNGQLIESGEDTLRIPSMGTIQTEDRGIYVASINNTFGGQSVNYTVIVNNFPPIINCETTLTLTTVTVTCIIITYPAININDIRWTRIYNGEMLVFAAKSNVGNDEVAEFRASSRIEIPRAECPLKALYRISVLQTSSVDNEPCIPVPKVTILEAEPVTDSETSIIIRWTNPMIVEPITGYVVQYRLQFTSVWQSVTINNGSATMYSVEGLIQDRNYEYRVQIVVDGIEQAFSDTNTYRPGTIPSDPPLNVDASKRASVGDTDVIVVKWKAVPAVITGYTVSYRTSFDTMNTMMVPASKLNLTIPDVIKAGTYYIKVQACNLLGKGPYSDEVISEPLSDPNDVPITVTITSLEISRSFVNIIWMIKPDSVTVTSVQLNISRIDVESNRRIQINTNDVTNNSQSSQCLSSLNGSTVYEFCVVVTTTHGQYDACERANSGTNDNFNHDTSNCASVAQPIAALGIEPWIIAIIVVTAILLVVVVFGGCGLILGVKKNKKSVDMDPYSTTEGALSEANGYPMRSASPPTSSCLSYNRNQHQMQWQGDYQYNSSGFSSPGFSPGYNSPGPVSAV